MSRDVVPFVLALTLLAAGCNRPSDVETSQVERTGKSNPGPDLARGFTSRIDLARAIGGGWINSDDVLKYAARENGDLTALVRSAIAMLTVDCEPDRSHAAMLLGMLMDPAAIGPLTQALEKDSAPDVRWEACRALRSLAPAPGAEDGVRKALKDADVSVRKCAVWSFSYTAALQSPDVLREVMRTDKSLAVRVAAAHGLVTMRKHDAATLNLLRSGLTEDSETREECEEALTSIGELKLPLPHEVYTPMDREEYLKLVKRIEDNDPPFGTRIKVTIERSTTKNGNTYFELAREESIDPALPASRSRRWYVVPAKPGR